MSLCFIVQIASCFLIPFLQFKLLLWGILLRHFLLLLFLHFNIWLLLGLALIRLVTISLFLIFRFLDWGVLFRCWDIFFDWNLLFFCPFFSHFNTFQTRNLMNVIAHSQDERVLFMFRVSFFDLVLSNLTWHPLHQRCLRRVMHKQFHTSFFIIKSY